jgi:tRNA-Thr(GGU) m(6)t(6)A37 methyltransferase TsaA
METTLKPIGVIRTPYTQQKPPHQPDPNAEGEFRIEVYPEFAGGLYKLESFSHIYVLFHLDRTNRPVNLLVTPPKAGGVEVGLFASRSPNRPNPIGLSIVGLKAVDDNRLTITGIDAMDRTPLLDIKPYVGSLDCKDSANDGWRHKR